MSALRAVDEWLMTPVGRYLVRYHFLIVALAWAVILGTLAAVS